jgi:hypothetical protein
MSAMIRSQSVYPVDENANSKYNEQQPREKKPAVVAPPMKYDLRTSFAPVAYNHISELTAHVEGDVQTFVHEHLKKILFENHCGRNNNQQIVFGYIPAPPNEVVMKQVIGTDGHFFKMTTTVCGVYFIWHDVPNKVFLFWGPSTFKVVKALNSIRWRIFKCYEVYNNTMKKSMTTTTTKQNYDIEEITDDEDDEDYSDMPGLISHGTTPDNETNDLC